MPILLALIGIAVGVYFWMERAKRTADVASDLMDAGRDLKNAARRFGFRRRANQHPVEGVAEPNLAIGGLAVAFLELDDLPTAEGRAATDIALRKHLNLDAHSAEEMTVLGRWLVSECGGALAAFPRLAKKLRQLDGAASFDKLMSVLGDISAATGGTPSTRQSEALADLARVFNIK